MTARDVEDFPATFTTPTLLARRSGLHRSRILAALAVRVIEPYRPQGQDVGALHLRKNVDPVIEEIMLGG